MEFFNRISRFLLPSFLIIVLVAPIQSFAAAPEAESGAEGSEKKELKEDVEQRYDRKLTKYNTYQSEIKSLKREIKATISQLKSLDESSPMKGQIREKVLVLHDDLEKAIENFNRTGAELRHKYPEKGIEGERKYFPYRKQSLEQIERELDLDDILTESLKLIEVKYRAFTMEEKKKAIQKLKKVEKKKKDRHKDLEVIF